MKYDLVKGVFFDVMQVKTKYPDKSMFELLDKTKWGCTLHINQHTFKNIFDLLDSAYVNKKSDAYIVVKNIIAYKYVKTLDMFEILNPITYSNFFKNYEIEYRALNIPTVTLILDYFDKMLDSYQDMMQAGFDITCSSDNMLNRFISNFYQIKTDIIDILSKNRKIEETELYDIQFEEEILHRPILLF
jgi:hypothetical protein